MKQPHTSSDSELYDGIDACQTTIAKAQREQLRLIAEFDKRELWQHDGCYHMGQWLAKRLGITVSEGIRRTNAAHVLEKLPYLAMVLETGRLSLEKVVQLARFVTSENVKEFVRYAQRTSLNAVRDRATLETRRKKDEVRSAHDSRYLRWYPLDELGSIGLDGRLPADQGAVLTKVIERIADTLEPKDDEDDEWEGDRHRRQADALMMLVMGYGGNGTPEPPTLVVHTSIDGLKEGRGGEIEGGPVVHPQIVEQIACDARLRYVLHDVNGCTIGIGYTSRNIPGWLRSELMRRDRGCVFCGTRRFAHGHHIVPWPDGPTNLDNLVLLCPSHHDLVHKMGWRVELDEKQMAVWYRPDGTRYEPGLRINRQRDDGDDDHRDEPPDTSGGSRLALIAAAFG